MYFPYEAKIIAQIHRMPFEWEAATGAIKGIGILHAPDQNELEKMLTFLGREHIYYSLRSILLFANIDVSRYILVIDISVFRKSNMGQSE
jgi:hypothetical protein